MTRRPKWVLTKLWKVIVHPISKATGEMIYKSRDELVESLKKIGLTDALIWLLFLRGLIEYNVGGDRLIIQLIEIVEKTRIL